MTVPGLMPCGSMVAKVEVGGRVTASMFMRPREERVTVRPSGPSPRVYFVPRGGVGGLGPVVVAVGRAGVKEVAERMLEMASSVDVLGEGGAWLVVSVCVVVVVFDVFVVVVLLFEKSVRSYHHIALVCVFVSLV